ncbi:unnamed protein product [Nesidiocoris tenuis]|uniref:Uncharacterized protein n=1 Tax=Nesidiocoris tenuis TaxID=355587 RepID=A0A6H5GTP1_9HEMI|nr:unnamed protein product [Nesidiocoris tenuis]
MFCYFRGKARVTMPCSAVSVEVRRESSAMPVPAARSDYSDYSRYRYLPSNPCVRRTANTTSSTSESISKYSARVRQGQLRLSGEKPTPGTAVYFTLLTCSFHSIRSGGLSSRSSSLTEELRDRSQTRGYSASAASSSGSSTSRSRTSSYSSSTIATSNNDALKTSSYPSSRKTYTTFDLNAFRETYGPKSYVAGSQSRMSTALGGDSSLTLTRPRPSLLPSKEKQSTDTSAEVMSSSSVEGLVNGLNKARIVSEGEASNEKEENEEPSSSDAVSNTVVLASDDNAVLSLLCIPFTPECLS